MNSAPEIWCAIQSMSHHFGYFTPRALFDLNRWPLREVKGYVEFLQREGAVELSSPTEHKIAHHLKVVRSGDAPPMPDTPLARKDGRRRAIWTAMRGLRTFTLVELAMAASTDKLAVGSAAGLYVRALTAADYLDEAHPGTYRLPRSRNTGPRAPLPTPEGVFDFNLMKMVRVNSQPLFNAGRAA